MRGKPIIIYILSLFSYKHRRIAHILTVNESSEIPLWSIRSNLIFCVINEHCQEQLKDLFVMLCGMRLAIGFFCQVKLKHFLKLKKVQD